MTSRYTGGLIGGQIGVLAAAGNELDTALPHDEQKRAVSTNRVPQSMQNMILTP